MYPECNVSQTLLNTGHKVEAMNECIECKLPQSLMTKTGKVFLVNAHATPEEISFVFFPTVLYSKSYCFQNYKSLDVNLFAFAYRLFHEDLSPINGVHLHETVCRQMQTN